MKYFSKAILFMTIVFTGVNCGIDPAPGTGIGSCVLSSDNMCYEYTGSSYDTAKSGMESCDGSEGVYSSGECPSSDASGVCNSTCIVYPDTSFEMNIFIYPGYTAGSTFCSIMGGTFSPDCP